MESTEHDTDRAIGQLLAQAHVLELEQHVLAAQLRQPDTRTLTFGVGNDAEQTLPGDPRTPWRGIAILNPTALTIYAGAGPSAQQPGLIVPPYSWICAPVNYPDYTLGVGAADAAGAAATITVIRLHQPPAGVRAGQLGAPGVPLADSVGTFGEVVGTRGSGVTLATLALAPGIYEIEAVTSTSAGNAGGDAVLALVHGLTTVAPLQSIPIATTARFPRVTIAPGETLNVVTTGTVSAGIICSVALTATRIG